MNCQSCNTSIDYRFLKNCPHCDCNVEGQSDFPQPLPSNELIKRALTWKQMLVNFAYVVASSIAGMISVTVVALFVGRWIYFTFLYAPGTTGCGEGMVVGLLSLLTGVFLGTMAGCAFGIKHPICKGGPVW